MFGKKKKEVKEFEKTEVFKYFEEGDEGIWFDCSGTKCCFPTRFGKHIVQSELTEYLEAIRKEREEDLMFMSVYGNEEYLDWALPFTIRNFVFLKIFDPMLEKEAISIIESLGRPFSFSNSEFEKLKESLRFVNTLDMCKADSEGDISFVSFEEAIQRLREDIENKFREKTAEIRKETVSRIREGSTPKWLGYKPSRVRLNKRKN